MKNKEKYIDFIVEAFADADVDVCEFRRKYVLKQKDCNRVICVECSKRTAEWLEQEYQESTLTEDEKAILRNLLKDYKWIARDEDGILFLYLSMPQKNGTWWQSGSLELDFSMYDDLFQFIKWEDEEPYSIDELLKQNGVER